MKVAVIGGGIGGLITTLALQNRGIDVELFESSREFRAAGAGIWMSPNSIKIMEKLNIAEEFKNSSIEMKFVQIQSNDEKPISTIDLNKIKKTHNHSIHAVKRQTLHDLIASKIDPNRIYTDKKLIDIKRSKDWVRAHFSDGTTGEFDALIGADGLHSTVRQILAPDIKPRATRQMCWYGLSDATIDPELHSMTTEIWSGKIRFGFAGVDGNQVYFFAVERIQNENQESIADKKAYLMKIFENGPGIIQTILEGSKNDSIIQTELKDLKPFQKIAYGNIALVGDAGHATTPNLGQGAAQAIESGYMIAELLSQYAPQEAIAKYELFRKERIKFIVGKSWNLGQYAHLANPIMRKFLYTVMKNTPDFIQSQLLNRAFSPKFIN